MKILLASIAAMALSAPLMAQTMTPTDTTTPPAGSMAAPTDRMSTPTGNTQAGTEVMLTERDGKWWNGDREATKAEISAHKKAQKMAKPR